MSAVISHKKTETVYFKGTLNNLKDQAHLYFDKLWQYQYITRDKAYAWMAEQLGVEEPKAHMRTMDEPTCKKVIEISIMILNDMRRLDLDFDAPIKHPYYELITTPKNETICLLKRNSKT